MVGAPGGRAAGAVGAATFAVVDGDTPPSVCRPNVVTNLHREVFGYQPPRFTSTRHWLHFDKSNLGRLWHAPQWWWPLGHCQIGKRT